MTANMTEGALLDELREEFPDFGLGLYQYDPGQAATVELYRTAAGGEVVTVFSGTGVDLGAALADVLDRARLEFAPPPAPPPPNIFD